MVTHHVLKQLFGDKVVLSPCLLACSDWTSGVCRNRSDSQLKTSVSSLLNQTKDKELQTPHWSHSHFLCRQEVKRHNNKVRALPEMRMVLKKFYFILSSCGLTITVFNHSRIAIKRGSDVRDVQCKILSLTSVETLEMCGGHIRGTGPWKVEGFSLMSLFLSSFTPTPEAPVQRNRWGITFTLTRLKLWFTQHFNFRYYQ